MGELMVEKHVQYIVSIEKVGLIFVWFVDCTKFCYSPRVIEWNLLKNANHKRMALKNDTSYTKAKIGVSYIEQGL